MLTSLKEGLEKISGCRIYRNTLPHGVDCSFDIERRFGPEGIKVIFDVGANVGQSAIPLSRRFPQAEIYGFEPVAATYQKLVAATKPFPRVHPYHLGMGREPGKMTIHVPPMCENSSIVLRRPESHPETIELETISRFAEKHHLEQIDFLKVDTEGYDLEVLAGAATLLQRQKIQFVLVECEPTVRTQILVAFPSVLEFLGGFGYRLFGVYHQQPDWDSTRFLLYWDALFICERLIDPTAKL